MFVGILVSSVVLGALLLAAIALVRRLGQSHSTLPVTAEWIEELSIDRYRPMARLLDSADIEYLRSQPGFTRQMEARVRAQRSRIFRGYLNCLDNDFKRVCLAMKLILAHSSLDRPDLASALVNQQVMFATGLLGAHFRVFLYRWGICSVDAGSLVKIFDTMQLELRSLVPSAMPVCA
ncbi:MAG: hypothetical protein ABI806_10005 [Candidatus Solibacter sp.]